MRPFSLSFFLFSASFSNLVTSFVIYKVNNRYLQIKKCRQFSGCDFHRKTFENLERTIKKLFPRAKIRLISCKWRRTVAQQRRHCDQETKLQKKKKTDHKIFRSVAYLRIDRPRDFTKPVHPLETLGLNLPTNTDRDHRAMIASRETPTCAFRNNRWRHIREFFSRLENHRRRGRLKGKRETVTGTKSGEIRVRYK